MFHVNIIFIVQCNNLYYYRRINKKFYAKTETIKVICYLEKVARNKKFIILKSMFELNISIAVTPARSSFCRTV